MERNEQKATRELYTIDLMHILKRLWQKIWLIAICSVMAAVVGFSIASFAVAPQYASSVMLYVNNNSISLGSSNVTFSASELTAAQSLVRTYIVMLNNRTTLEMVRREAGVPYDYKYLSGMITASSVNDTEVMEITVRGKDPYEVARIANAIEEVLPKRLSEIIDGSSMAVVDRAVPNLNKVAPSITTYTLVGFALGLLLSVVGVAITAMLDNTIHDEEYILQTYQYPILAKVPNLYDTGKRRYGYYYRRAYKTETHADGQEGR